MCSLRHLRVPQHTIRELSYSIVLVPLAVQVTVLCLHMTSSGRAMPSDLSGNHFFSNLQTPVITYHTRDYAKKSEC